MKTSKTTDYTQNKIIIHRYNKNKKSQKIIDEKNQSWHDFLIGILPGWHHDLKRERYIHYNIQGKNEIGTSIDCN